MLASAVQSESDLSNRAKPIENGGVCCVKKDLKRYMDERRRVWPSVRIVFARLEHIQIII